MILNTITALAPRPWVVLVKNVPVRPLRRETPCQSPIKRTLSQLPARVRQLPGMVNARFPCAIMEHESMPNQSLRSPVLRSLDAAIHGGNQRLLCEFSTNSDQTGRGTDWPHPWAA